MNGVQLNQNCGDWLKNIIQFERTIYAEDLECQAHSKFIWITWSPRVAMLLILVALRQTESKVCLNFARNFN